MFLPLTGREITLPLPLKGREIIMLLPFQGGGWEGDGICWR